MSKRKGSLGTIPNIHDDDLAIIGQALFPVVDRDGPQLLALAYKSFPDLTPPEIRFFRNLCIVSFNVMLPDEKDETKSIRACCLSWILQDRRAIRLLTTLGIVVWGASFKGVLFVNQCQARIRVQLDSCRFDSNIYIQDASLALLSLRGSACHGLVADRTNINGCVFLSKNASFTKMVSLSGAEIGGNLECDGGKFENTDGKAFQADGIKVKGGIFFNNHAEFIGEVRLLGAEIGKFISCAGSKFSSKTGYSFCGDGIKVSGGVFFNDGAEFYGEVILLRASIESNFTCAGSTFINKNSDAISMDGINIKGDMSLGGHAVFEGTIRIPGAYIGGNLDCIGSRFTGSKECSFIADGAKVAGSIFMRGDSIFKGVVRLLGVEVGGNFECDGGEFYKSDFSKNAIDAAGIVVNGSVFIRKFNSNGKVHECKIEGLVNLLNAKIRNRIVIQDMSQSNWSLCLSHASVEVLLDNQYGWPEPGKLFLDGFYYGRLDEQSEWDLVKRLGWLSRHNNSIKFNPQPYEQLAAVYREAGHEAEARDVLIEKNKMRLKERCDCLPDLCQLAGTWPGWPRSLRAFLPWMLTILPVWLGKAHRPCRSHAGYWLLWLFGKICAFGYKPWRAAGWWFGIWFPACILVWFFNAMDWIVPTYIDLNPATNSTIGFSSPGYAFDLMTPIFDMGYTMAWTPDNSIIALILLAIGTAGYILVALFAASITGLIRR